ncbi:MAG: response regulator [Burkholderiales bacterium]|nr:response regulator [Burkholderiales bacterium]
MSVKENVPKILVVNDDPGSLLALTSLLAKWAEEEACEIHAARSGHGALRHVLQHDFAVILLDVNMPGMDGFETAQAIHLRTRSSSVPIIFITAYHADEMDRLKGYQNGAADYLFTPIIPQILKAKLSAFVALARKNLELHAQAAMLDKRTNELVAINARLALEISERKIAEQENKAKDDFLAMLGHELRNPLAAITSAAYLLNASAASTDQIIHARGVIQRQSLHLKRIVDDLLDLSRVMSGKILLDKQPVEFSELVRGCVDTLQLTGRAGQHKINLQTEKVWISGDASRIEQIITNLLDNAFKYTPPGGAIDVEVGAENDVAVFKVGDSGVGIDADLLPHIFDVFVQGDNSLDRTQGGLGIGLALVRQLAALHGGTATASSKGQGNGSLFVVQIPAIENKEAAAPSVHPSRSESQCKVLLIDDNEDGRTSMAMGLSAFGNSVLSVPEGIAGLRLAREQQPDIALIDIGLPGMDGYEVARQLRADPATRRIKLVALTGYGLKTDRLRALEAGFDMHLVKPVYLEELNEVIAACMASL